MGMIRSYIDYKLKAKSRHGVHSPFVYRIVEEVIQSNDAVNMDTIEELRKALKNNREKLMLRDLGAGSRDGKGDRRSIAQIAKSSATRPADAMMLQRLIDHTGCGSVLELGANLGITTAYMASAHCAPRVLSIEGDAALAALARANLAELGLEAEVVTGSFDDTLPACLEKLGAVDMAYIDGNHRREPTLNYFNQIVPYTHENSFIAIGDIHWSDDMEGAWEAIRQKPEVSISIDLFYMGLVFFKLDQAREHFTLKYP